MRLFKKNPARASKELRAGDFADHQAKNSRLSFQTKPEFGRVKMLLFSDLAASHWNCSKFWLRPATALARRCSVRCVGAAPMQKGEGNDRSRKRRPYASCALNRLLGEVEVMIDKCGDRCPRTRAAVEALRLAVDDEFLFQTGNGTHTKALIR